MNPCCMPGPAEHWHEVINRDGSVAYYNKVYNISKPQLSEAERQKLLPALDPYHNPLYTPLEQFVDHPIAKELIHNGIFFQVRCCRGWQVARPGAVPPAWSGCEAG